MGQRRAGPDPYRFDLVADDDPEGGASTPAPADSEPEPSNLLDRVRAWPRRRVVAGIAVAVVLVGGSGVASTLVERQRVAVLRSAPGGVVDLSTPPEVTWSVDVVNGSPVTLLGGLVAVVSYPNGLGPAPEDAQLRAIDPADGSEVWRRDFEGEWSCGPTAHFSMSRFTLASSESVVCVRNGRDGAVEVVDAAGQVVAERRLDGEDTRVPAADGGVVRLRRVGEPGPLPEVLGDEESGYRLDRPFVAADLLVTMEDAATGDVRWEATVESTPTGPDNWHQCVAWDYDESLSEPQMDPAGSNYYGLAEESVVVVGGCGVDAAFTPAGVRLDLTDASDATLDQVDDQYGVGSFETVERTVDGHYLRPAQVDEHGQYSQSPYAPWDLVDGKGAVLASLPGRGAEPWATDGSHPGVVIAQVSGGLAAIRASDGEAVWEADLAGPADVLVRTEDLVLAGTGDHELVALDLSSGERRWTAPLGGDESGPLWSDATQQVRAAFTDGRVAVVGSPGLGMPETPRWTAVDLRTGEVAWTWEPHGGAEGYGFAVDGRMLSWNYGALVGLG